MKFKPSIYRYVLLPVFMLAAWLGWAETGKGAAAREVESAGVYIVTHREIVRSGARNLADVLERVPGIRITFNTSQSRPSSGPLVSSDSPTRLSASQFSRILILFNGHPLNKKWHGGADQEWGTGFLEGLKEIRIYTGPAAMTVNGGFGGMDLVIDLIPFSGDDQQGGVGFRLSQSLNEDRLDKSVLHMSTGNRWGENGHYSFFGDATQWAGADFLDGSGWMEPGSRIDRKDPSFQLGTLLKRGSLDFMARHQQHYHFDPNNCGRKWIYTFLEATHTFSFSTPWKLRLTAGLDRIVSQWGAASSAEGEATGDWDKVTESRLLLRAGLEREFKSTSLLLGADFEAFKIDGGLERSDDYYSVMNFSARRSRVGGYFRLQHHLSGHWWLRGAARIEKAEGYANVSLLPQLSLFYQGKNTRWGLGFGTGQRYMDTWYRLGSAFNNPDQVFPGAALYVVPVELKPERNVQVKGWLYRQLGGPWVIRASVYIGKYSHLMGLDWDFTLEHLFNQVRAVEVGSYSYWEGTGSLFYQGKNMEIGASVSWQGTFDAQLQERQLYLNQDGDQPLYLAPMVVKIFWDWQILSRLSLSARYYISGASSNGGIDLESIDFPAVFDSGVFQDTPSYSRLDVSLRLLKLLKKFEIQLSVHNVLDDHAKLPIVEGGFFLSRGREATLTLRRHF
jgi:hypothetical protein